MFAQMQDLCKTLPEYSVVRDKNCIGDVLAPHLIAEISIVQSFKHSESFSQ